MANPKLEVRLPPIMHAYLDDLAAIGYGKGKPGVARRFIENAITEALETKIISTRKASDFDDGGDDD
jgi:hypothetical protein